MKAALELGRWVFLAPICQELGPTNRRVKPLTLDRTPSS
jgi:hypothetical protein